MNKWLFLIFIISYFNTACMLFKHPQEPDDLFWGYEPKPIQKLIDDFEDGNFISFLGTTWAPLADNGGPYGDGSPSVATINIITDDGDGNFSQENKVLKFNYKIGEGNAYQFSMFYVPLPSLMRNLTGFTGLRFDWKHSGKGIVISLESPLTIADGYDHYSIELNSGSIAGTTNWYTGIEKSFYNFTRGGWGTKTISIESVLSNVTAIQFKVASPNNSARKNETGSCSIDNLRFIP